jgi:hypothetical protein
MMAVTTTDPIADVILGAGFVFTVWLALRNGHKADKVAEKADKVVDKLGEVHDLVNGQLTDAVDRRDISEARTRVLEDEAKG